MIETITFDLWNTIFQNKSYSESRINFLLQYLTHKGLIDNRFLLQSCYDHIFLHYSNENPNGNFQHIYNEYRIDKVLKCLKVILSDSEKEEILEVLESEMLNDPPLLKVGVRDALTELSPQYKIGLISNRITPGHVIKKVLEKYDILKFFQVTIFSDEIGYYKPNCLLFQKALIHLGAKPGNSIHIGDLLLTDIKGAKDYGMLSIWFNDLHQKRQSEIIPDFEVSDIREIIKIIKSI
ncbi:MAG: HAD family hydrolase [Candidatus Lokiarchaeota archaeon]